MKIAYSVCIACIICAHAGGQERALNLTLIPNWFENGEKFWYAAERPGGKREFLVVDCAKGTKTVTAEKDLPKDAKKPESSFRHPYARFEVKSPDGNWQVLQRNHNLILVNLKNDHEKNITHDGVEESAWKRESYWSPDSQKFVAFKWVPPGDRRVVIVESSPKDQIQPRVLSDRYLKPGDPIAIGIPHLFDVQSGKEIPIDTSLFATPWEIDRFHWDPDSKRFLFLYNMRGHQVMRVIAIDAATGKATAIIDEQSKTFIDYSNKTYLNYLPSGDILWMSERSGSNAIHRIDGRTGKVLNRVTPEGVARFVEWHDVKKNRLLVRMLGLEKNPYIPSIGWCEIDTGEWTPLASGDTVPLLAWSPDRKYCVRTTSNIRTPPKHVLCDDSGKDILELETARVSKSWEPPELIEEFGRDGKTKMYGYITKPRNFDPAKKYPVIEHVYNGPQDYYVNHRFTPVRYEQSMADRGFIVIKVDAMGTNWRSKAFHDVAYQNLKDGGFPDRIAVIKALAKTHPEMDLSKGVGVYGGSAGGQNALAALLHHSDFYTVGVADCGCHDNRMDKVWWNEAWMGWPVGPHYADNSNVTHAHKLKGKLMLIVGEVDRNVDPASTMQVVNALVKADKDFDLLVMPGVGHGAAETPYASRRRGEFFERHLK